ncbi:hypothetical protein [Azohydromonas aeria]|uniref:hypothetical protein n=1 Tax=Azohydromonas aeria TaxID=2590212 RepID=UPI0012FB0D0B|nr:hypothetical protein [Azohydromonas aeria]
MKANPLAVAFFTLAFFADYLEAFGIGFGLKAGVTLIFLVTYVPAALQMKRASLAAMLLALGYLSYCLFRFSSFAASTYEFTKLLLALIFILGCINASTGSRRAAAGPVRLESALQLALTLAIAINAFFVLIQVLLGNHALIAVGVPSNFFDGPQKEGRYSGLILNLPLWSSMLFVRLLRIDRKLFPVDAWPASRIYKFMLYGLLILSGQKYIIMCTLIYLALRLPFLKITVLAVVLALVAPLLLNTENFQIVDRMRQAADIVDTGIINLFRSADASADYPQFLFLDLRLNSWLYSLANIIENPFGRGLGTWGDFSASLNPQIVNPITLSESQWAHMLVEQGYGAFAFLLLASAPFLFAHRALRSNLRWLGFLIFLAGWFTMGTSDYLWFFVTFALLFNLRAVHNPTSWRRRPRALAQP